MKAMILAAGYGKRMRPLSTVLPKPLLPLLNMPAIDYSINLLKNSGIKEVVINTFYKKEEMLAFFKDKTDLGLKVHFSREEVLLGTAGGIKKAEEFLKDDTFIVINCDTIIDIDLKEVLQFHKERNALVTMVLREDRDIEKYGIIGIDSKNKVRRFLKHGSDDKTLKKMMFTGVQVFEPEVLKEIPEGRPCEISLEIYPRLIKEGYPVFGFVTEKYWMDMGTHKKYLKVHSDILSGKYPSFEELQRKKEVSLNIHHELKDKNINIIPPVIIDESCLVGEGCQIGPNVVIGKDSTLGRSVNIKNSVIFGKAVLSDNAFVSNSILSFGASIEKGSRIRDRIIIKMEDKQEIYPINDDYF